MYSPVHLNGFSISLPQSTLDRVAATRETALQREVKTGNPLLPVIANVKLPSSAEDPVIPAASLKAEERGTNWVLYAAGGTLLVGLAYLFWPKK